MNFAPHDYQTYAIDYIETHPVAAVLLDMGLGKTVITLTAIADLLFDSFEAHRILVVAPLRVARDTWPAEIRKWQHLKSPDLRCLCGNTERAKSCFDGKCRHHHHQQRKPTVAHRIQRFSLRLRYGGHRRALILQESQFKEIQVPPEGKTQRQAYHWPDWNTIIPTVLWIYGLSSDCWI